MFVLFSRNLFFLAFLLSFLFLLTPSVQAQTADPQLKPSKPTVWEYRQKVDGGSYGMWTVIANSSGNSLSASRCSERAMTQED